MSLAPSSLPTILAGSGCSRPCRFPTLTAALREIEYTLDTLKMDGICMMTDYQGKFLGDAAFRPVLEELNWRKAVVYTHPFRNDCCRNLVPDVFEPLIELGTDTTRTIASVLFSGSAEQFPDINWIFSHAGGTAPFLMQRFTYYFDARKDLQPRLPKGPAYYMQRFHYDTANAMTIHPLASLTKLVTPTQILFGTDFPFLTAKGHRSRSARGGAIQCRRVADDRARKRGPADAAIQIVGLNANVRAGWRRRFIDSQPQPLPPKAVVGLCRDSRKGARRHAKHWS